MKSVTRQIVKTKNTKKIKPTLKRYSVSSSDSERSSVGQLSKEMCVDSDIDMDFDDEHLTDGLLDDETVSVGDFILVKFATKKKILHFVGNVKELLDCGEYLVKFLRKNKNYGFHYPIVDDISVIPREDIISKLPIPEEVKGTARLASYIKFNVSFMNYNVQ